MSKLDVQEFDGAQSLRRYKAVLEKLLKKANESWLPHGQASAHLIGILAMMYRRPGFPSPEQLWLLEFYRHAYMLMDDYLTVGTRFSEDAAGKHIDSTIISLKEMLEQKSDLPEVKREDEAFWKRAKTISGVDRKKHKKAVKRRPELERIYRATAELILARWRRRRDSVSSEDFHWAYKLLKDNEKKGSNT